LENLSKFITSKATLLEKAGIEQGKAEIEIILCHLLNVDRLKLYLEGATLLNEDIKSKFEVIFNKRLVRYPLQYLLGEAWFYGRRFFVSEAVMVPTPETEILCLKAINFIHEKGIKKPRILDLGTGSGVIAITLALELGEVAMLAVDITPEALTVAKKNADLLGVMNKIEWRLSDLFTALKSGERFELICSNPPYITNADYEKLPPEVLADPKIALIAGDRGLDIIEKIIRQAPDFLCAKGRIIFEIGYNQAGWVKEMVDGDRRYHSIEIIKDLNNIDRVVILTCENR